ncbi:meiotic recombination protein REC114-like [Stylophora pistillata]|uniref:meiotic recombination protein REC114-like n=1 Tax=Stylophora pistillata TaxID=50429 RepID=UPI000C03C4DC|nr:meiotic recombination protein REC114-like [Stylophora pistillata]
MLSTNAVVRSWPLEKYAKFIYAGESGGQSRSQGYWKQFSSAEGGCDTLQLSLLESNMIVRDGKVMHESFSLFNASKWLKAIVKGDSMLFFYKMNNDCRRFRIKFNKSTDRSAIENCHHFVSEISPQIPVRELPVSTESDSQVPMEDSQPISLDSQPTNRGTTDGASCGSATVGLTLPALASEGVGLQVLSSYFLVQITSVESRLDAVHSGSHLDIPQDQLSLMIRLCLTDSNFPDFVEAVEKELKNLTSSE